MGDASSLRSGLPPRLKAWQSAPVSQVAPRCRPRQTSTNTVDTAGSTPGLLRLGGVTDDRFAEILLRSPTTVWRLITNVAESGAKYELSRALPLAAFLAG
ncbi:hypothetical protein EGT51_03145 [Levilactobacillus suantsaiihabitans]|uniref:Uncharacterized protein n=1 Tax=Levilactobacillus suantsaiihabitans TaxID=2487722 RepID=A0A4Z0JCG2_9LACO|nr:hypothetical protein EGT51_03145 [Levilactobacillus suantsaiihabitans]